MATATPFERDVIAAMRLALAAGANDAVKVRVVEALLGQLPASDDAATQPVHLLLAAVKDADAEFVVTDSQ